MRERLAQREQEKQQRRHLAIAEFDGDPQAMADEILDISRCVERDSWTPSTGRSRARRSACSARDLIGGRTPMSDIVSEAEQQRRVERMDDVKRALKQGSNVARRTR